MNKSFEGLTVSDLYDLRDYINCTDVYTLEVKQSLMDGVTEEISTRQLVELMRPITKEFIDKREGSDVR